MDRRGIEPNQQARRLRAGQTWVFSFDSLAEHNLDPYVMSLERQLLREVEASGYSLTISGHAPDGFGPAIGHRSRSRSTDGAFVLGGGWLKDADPLVATPWHPCVCFDITAIARPHSATVVTDLRPGIAGAVEALVAAGHRRIAYVGWSLETTVREMVRVELEAHGAVLDTSHELVAGDLTVDAGAQAVRELLGRPSPPSAVIARKDVIAVGMVSEALRMGKSIPGDLSIIAFDDTFLATAIHPRLSTITIDTAAVAAAGARLMLCLRNQPDDTPTPLHISCPFTSRETVGPPR
jgi:LacI family transcriptional regulator